MHLLRYVVLIRCLLHLVLHVTEEIGTVGDADWQAGPVKSATMGFKKNYYRIAPK